MSDNRYGSLDHHADLSEGADEFEGPRRYTRPSEWRERQREQELNGGGDREE